MAEASGFLNINKPLGMTSHDVVAKLRRGLKIKKVGHAGTLDPLATGVLVICVGNATRLSEYVMQSQKTYRAQIHLGVTTDTYDAEGSVINRQDASGIRRDQVEEALRGFLGDIDQMPPMYSAIKQGGRKLYDLARAGETVERERRRITIHSLDVVNYSLPEFTLDVTCSAGTYIRSLAYDIGELLGVGAHLAGLARLASGRFTIETAVSPDTVLSTGHWGQHLVSPEMALADWPRVDLTIDDTEHIMHGRAITASASPNTIGFGYAPDGQLIAILRADDGHWRPHKVFSNDPAG